MNLENIPPSNNLTVTVRNRERLLFEGKALALSSYDDAGPFDVLPLHTNFISVVKNMLTIIKEDGSRVELPVERGVLKVSSNRVEIYMGFENKPVPSNSQRT